MVIHETITLGARGGNPFASLLREIQFAVARNHFDAIARFEFAEEELGGQRV